MNAGFCKRDMYLMYNAMQCRLYILLCLVDLLIRNLCFLNYFSVYLTVSFGFEIKNTIRIPMFEYDFLNCMRKTVNYL